MFLVLKREEIKNNWGNSNIINMVKINSYLLKN